MYPEPCHISIDDAVEQRRAYVSVLSTDSYLNGVLVLHHSLMSTGTFYPFLLLISDAVSAASRQILSSHGINFKLMQRTIENPTATSKDDHWAFTYSKLDIFNQTQFDKIVFLDADMLIVENIDELFEKQHMSAVNAGGMLAEYAHWTGLNSGLMVIEPSRELYRDMIGKVGKIEQVERGGDQDFLQAYYPDWVDRPELHLDHGYNMFHCHLDRYRHLGYAVRGGAKPVKVIHYIGGEKPWNMDAAKFVGIVPSLKKEVKKIISICSSGRFHDEQLIDSVGLWHRMFSKASLSRTGCKNRAQQI